MRSSPLADNRRLPSRCVAPEPDAQQLMLMWEALALVVVVLGIGFFVDGLRVREAAIRVAKDACRQHGLQLLDYTVQGARTRFARDANGVARLRRTFVFEFSDDGVTRRSGSIVMLGAQAESLQLEPYRPM